MSDFVQQNATEISFNSSDSWVILSPIEQSIKRKIETVGTPLKDWDIQINYGIKTGFNDAFIITTETREQILSNCADEDERKRTEEIIRPILRGRDIKKYGYDWAGLWLINTHNGIKGKLDRVHIEDYPAIKAHLDQYWDKISTRADKGNTPYNLRNCAYLDEFYKPKVFYPDITQNLDFAFCKDIFFCNNTSYFLSSDNPQILKHILHFINHKLYDWYYRTISVQLGATAVRMFSIYVLNLPVPTKFVENIYEAFDLSKEEEAFIDSL